MIKKINKKNQKGFTLVELLVVISLVGILASVTISILNPVKQRKVAEDGVKQSNLQKYALGVEAYANANSSYPTAVVDTTPADNKPDDTELRNFVGIIPNGEPSGATYTYVYTVSDDSFSIAVAKSETAGSCFKYRSSWGKIKSCTTCDGSSGC